MKKIELLAPAKNLQVGIEAIKHGADAVYIGGPNFGARASAGNSVNEIAQLCSFAHLYGARVYVTLNTILYDNELEEARNLIYQLYEAQVDALIVQDLAICSMQIPPIEIHASTQLDITTPEKAQLLEHAGFKQIVLARELSLQQIKDIKSATSVPLEAFVHGALCVSYSGRCYASEYCFSRSANRGQCAQFCRLPFTLKDANGHIIRKDKHLLSLRDMNRSMSLEEMIDAGITSFKIEGRLKDCSYVKNVTAYYSTLLNQIIQRRKDELQRSSSGKVQLQFTPQLDKSFNRGFTEYFLHGKRRNEANFDTPKSIGEHIGKITRITGNRIEVILESGITINAGDGLCFCDYQGTLQGFRANTVTHTDKKNKFIVTYFGKQVFTFSPNHTLELFRNFDTSFEKLLEKETATRKLLLHITLKEVADGFVLSGRDELNRTTSVTIYCEHQPSKTPQRENILRQLLKVGDTPYQVEDIDIDFTADWFIPSSALTNARRSLIHQLEACRLPQEATSSLPTPRPLDTDAIQSKIHFDYRANIANKKAHAFYTTLGFSPQQPAFEVAPPKGRKAIMFCKHCIRYELGMCKKLNKQSFPYTEPFTLHSADGRKFELSFNCKDCEMTVWTTE